MEKKIIIISFILAALFLYCRPDTATEEQKRRAEAYRDSVFLVIEGGDLDELFMEAQVNHRVYYRAVERINEGVRIQGDTLFLSIRSGAEIKVSENIYDYVARMIALGNRKLKTDTLYEIRQVSGTNSFFVTRKDAPPCKDF